MVDFVKGDDQVQADHISLAVGNTEGAAMPLAMYRPVYITFTGIATSAAEVVIGVAGVL